MVAPHGRGHTRLLPRRGCAGPPLLALPRGPLRAGRNPSMVRTRDVCMSSFAELAAATNFSFLRGASHPHEIVGQAAELGLAAVGIADHNTLAGVVRAFDAAKEHKIRCLSGARLVTTDGFEAVCYPTDRAAYGRLCRLLTEGNRRAVKGQCHLGFDEVLAASEGQILIAIPPCDLTPAFSERLGTLAATAR